MSENTNKNTDENKTPNNRRLFPQNNKNRTPGGGSNFYWIYGVITLLFVASYFYNLGSSALDVKTEKFTEMLRAGDVKEITVINKEYAEITLSKEALANLNTVILKAITQAQAKKVLITCIPSVRWRISIKSSKPLNRIFR